MKRSASLHHPRAGAGRAPHIVIVGAGFGGLAAAKELARYDLDVTLVDRQNHHLFQPLLYQVATAGLSPADVAAPIRSIVKKQKRTRVLLDQVDGIDHQAKTVSLSSGATLHYDSLILATGATHSYFGNEGWAEHAPGIKTIDDALHVRRQILLALEHAETNRQQNVEERAEFLTFLIVGGGPTGVEMAGAVAELTRHAADMDFHYITRRCVRIILIEAGQRLLATFPERLSEAARRALVKLGVEVRLGSRVTSIDAAGAVVDDELIRSATIIWAAGVKASPAAQWLDLAPDRAGRVIVDASLQVADRAGVYAIGDTAAATSATGQPVPGIAPAAKQQGVYVAHHIAAKLGHRRAPTSFRYRHFGSLATIGRKRAVVDLGWVRFSGLAAWILWSTAHIYFLAGFRNRFVVGANWLWNYMTFERSARLITGLGTDIEGVVSAARVARGPDIRDAPASLTADPRAPGECGGLSARVAPRP
ncbi:NAD(P)/FAD-dependent oxidoreductase [Sphingomonas sp. PAMC 26605]|uniref:NAD(P)/FAD-dependent oxidoreductase n=1 Tax=Sphingomonas sp. PAMC 26605 TaxID=1112214 RepID=UPI001E3B1B5A|nr:NAD(P)/FAD-dependent oxidoreductase [Sphingomonas sp. PAMC 26605]